MTDRTPGNARRRRLPDTGSGSQRRRSPRLSAAPPKTDDKMVAVKRSITVRKIAPRKTAAPSEHDKENTPRHPAGAPEAKQRLSTPGPNRRSSTASGKPKKKSSMPSPILPSPPQDPQGPQDPQDLAWSQKVRRSYSRLSDPELHSPASRDTLFGFEKLQTPEVVRRVGAVRTGLDVSASLCPLTSFTLLLEAEAASGPPPPPPPPPETDPHIPGVSLVKEKRRRRKVQQMDTTELDALAARMNAEFEEAEEFQLVVE